MSGEFKRIAIVGSGAIGLYYGGRLAAAGEDVHFLLRSDYQGIRSKGLTVESVHGDFRLPAPQVWRDSRDIGPVDLAVITWKTTANPLLREVLTPLLHPGTVVLTLQNGLGNCETIESVIGPQHPIVGGLCFVCINRIEPGLISHTAGGRVSIGAWHPTAEAAAREITARFKAAGIHASQVENLQRAQWEKLIWNIPFNGLSVAEGGVTTDVLLADPRTEAEIRALMHEVIAAGRALGLDLTDDLATHNIERTRPMGAYRTSSMIDYLEGREVEVAPIWEEPLRQARAAGVSMPHLESLLERIREQIKHRKS
jgi:2-dehydropantoate 2-reductase